MLTLEFKKLFPLPCSARFWSHQGEIFLFVFCFPFAHINDLQLLLNILGEEYIILPFTVLYINFRTDANKLYPQKVLAVVLKIYKKEREAYVAIRLNVT